MQRCWNYENSRHGSGNCLNHNPKFLALIDRSQARHKSEGGISSQALRRKLARRAKRRPQQEGTPTTMRRSRKTAKKVTQGGRTAETYGEDGVDLTLIRWMLSLTPAQRLRMLQASVRSDLRMLAARTRA